MYESDGDISVVSINRPDKLNALNETVISELDFCFDKIESDESVKGVLITGAGDKAFVAGADISQFPSLQRDDAVAFARKGQTVFSRIEAFPKPVVAAINGYALGGGCELALACHLRVAASSASFGQPEVGLGVIPGYGGTQRLPRIVGVGSATEMILTGRPVSAQRAYEIGLVNLVVEQDALLEGAKKLLRSITSKAPLAVRYAMQAIRAAGGDAERGMLAEADLFGEAFATADMKEGVGAFLERRKPNFSGH
ncbi:MAG: enoyl-CoA hydratase [Rhodothermales bacterium]|nr:enoyl-CoA hydratase [Rhodothermales bacterium]